MDGLQRPTPPPRKGRSCSVALLLFPFFLLRVLMQLDRGGGSSKGPRSPGGAHRGSGCAVVLFLVLTMVIGSAYELLRVVG